ncbi:isoleucine--tRNA ligase [Patescibacteria group bacterium]|nr:isoleucine--tRNA ligase [Patescibacteria group bacterium]
MSDERPADAQNTRPNFPQMEEEILAFWQKKGIFERSIEERSESKTFVFYDGPPFATGMPHPGHLLQSAIKDAVPRYKTMQGYRVPRRWGWDCHGLPMEALVQKELKLGTKKDIEEYGIGAFNEKCASSVLLYANEWRRYVERFGRWVDMDNAYKTMDSDFIESVWWAFAELWKKQLVYKDLRVSLYSPSNGTPLSNFEVAMENSYVDMEDPSVTIKFKVVGEENTYLLAWTTTPWTLPANVALAVHPNETYVTVRVGEENLICAEKLLSKVFREFYPLTDDAPFEVLKQQLGSELKGMAYEPLFPLSDEAFARMCARDGKTRYEVVDMGYVSMEDGTGIVHTAPAFGEEDFMAAKSHELPVLVTIDDAGIQLADVPVGAGSDYLDSNDAIMTDLKSRRLVYREEKIMHSVAIFARNNTRLIYKAQPAWYVNVTKLKPKLLDTAKKINWHPEHFKEGRFGKGLETAPDWCISRSRFWGAPLPVWTNADGTDVRIFASLAELEAASGKKIDRKHSLNLHRPGIDGIVFENEKGEEMRRIDDVFDCWFESGSMPYASVHYPFENREFFEENYPADFIAEAQDQTRGWFYTLHVLSTALYGKPAFTNIICTGLLMAEDGKKMSKSLKNYSDPWDVMQRIGADAMRVYMLSSPVVDAEQLNFSEKDCETVQRALFGTLWNVRAFYLLAGNNEHPEITKPKSAHVLDRWLTARLALVQKETTEAMERYDLVSAIRPLRAWVDDLSTWWLRRSRDRLKGDNSYDKHDALRTLREALLDTSLLLAPFAPFFAEKLYQDLGGAKMSVHLDRWPKPDERLIDEGLLSDMKIVREVVAASHDARVKAKMPVRQALGLLTVRLRDSGDASRLSSKSDLLALLRDELNVERVVVQGGAETGDEAFTVELDTTLTPELKKKGMARELSRHLMNLRKEMKLSPSDSIAFELSTEDHGLRDTLEQLAEMIAKDVRATSYGVGDTGAAAETEATVEIDGRPVVIRLRRA